MPLIKIPRKLNIEELTVKLKESFSSLENLKEVEEIDPVKGTLGKEVQTFNLFQDKTSTYIETNVEIDKSILEQMLTTVPDKTEKPNLFPKDIEDEREDRSILKTIISNLHNFNNEPNPTNAQVVQALKNLIRLVLFLAKRQYRFM